MSGGRLDELMTGLAGVAEIGNCRLECQKSQENHEFTLRSGWRSCAQE
jgi:hypothetical protein